MTSPDTHLLRDDCLRQSDSFAGEPTTLVAGVNVARSPKHKGHYLKEFIPTRDRRLTTTEAFGREQKIVRLALDNQDSKSPLSSCNRA